jgi:hypothetical protein
MLLGMKQSKLTGRQQRFVAEFLAETPFGGPDGVLGW